MFIKNPKKMLSYVHILTKNRLFMLMLFLGFYSLFYGLIIKGQEFTTSYSLFRNLLFFVIFFFLFKNTYIRSIKDLNSLCYYFIFILALYLILIILHFHLNYVIFWDWLVYRKIRVPIFLIISLILYSAFTNKMFISTIFFLFLIYVAYMSNYRLYFVFIGYSAFILLIGFAYNMRNNNKRKIIVDLSLISVSMLALINVFYFKYFDDFIMSTMTDFKYSQLVRKFTVLYDYGLAGDKSIYARNEPIKYIINNLDKFILPRGFGFNAYQLFDSGPTYFLVIYGFLGTLTIFILFVLSSLSILKHIDGVALKSFFVSLVSITLFYIFITPDIFIISELGISSAMALGLLCNISFYNLIRGTTLPKKATNEHLNRILSPRRMKNDAN